MSFNTIPDIGTSVSISIGVAPGWQSQNTAKEKVLNNDVYLAHGPGDILLGPHITVNAGHMPSGMDPKEIMDMKIKNFGQGLGVSNIAKPSPIRLAVGDAMVGSYDNPAVVNNVVIHRMTKVYYASKGNIWIDVVSEIPFNSGQDRDAEAMIKTVEVN